MKTGNQQKWYNNKGLIILLFFIFPPVGIYAILKYNTKAWKKILYIILALIPSFILFMLLMYLIIPQEELDRVERERIEKINSTKQLKNNNISTSKPQKSEITIDENKLKSLNEKWADSVVKSWKGKYIISYDLNEKNAINLELSKEATKSYYSNKKENLSFYQNNYNKLYQNQLKVKNSITKISFIPNKEFSEKYDTNDWGHPVLMNKGVQIYSGNKFYKEYLGTLECKYKDPTDRMLYYVIRKPNRDRIKIENGSFRTYYWISQKDSKRYIGNGIPTCKDL